MFHTKYLNEIVQGDCLELMKELPNDCIDLVVTSPPYDNLREYKGYSFDFENIAKELYRIIKPGGVVVWVIADSYDKKGSETLTSFKQALFFKEIGFNVHDTMIYKKDSYPFRAKNRYYQQFEYMFVFSKGKPKTHNIIEQETKPKTLKVKSASVRLKDGKTYAMRYEKGKSKRALDNVWEISTGYMRTTKDKYAYSHPAMFPEELAEKHIISWSNENDVVLDIFGGSGTTAKMAKINKRNFMHFEISEEYCEIANKRVSEIS